MLNNMVMDGFPLVELDQLGGEQGGDAFTFIRLGSMSCDRFLGTDWLLS